MWAAHAGVGVAFLASLIFKTKFLRHHHTPLESCMVVLFALSSYMLADSFGLSGIVSILFCGLVPPSPLRSFPEAHRGFWLRA